VSWKWAPDQCDLPRFDPGIFLETVRGKKMAFIGDSLARNHMESLLCLLSQVTYHTISFFFSTFYFCFYYYKPEIILNSYLNNH